MKLYRIETCQFKRNKSSKDEKGLLLNEGEMIVDSNCKVVSDCWNWIRETGFRLDMFPFFYSPDESNT